MFEKTQTIIYFLINMKRVLLSACILSIGLLLKAARVDTLDVFSKSMEKFIKTCVILPDNYNNVVNSYPTLYLLHGYSGNYASWIKNFPQVIHFADKYDIIIVCPDGDYSSWYYDSPIDSTKKYETFVTKELISFIDTTFMTIKSPEGRATTGLSMGGHGAFYLSFKHQDIWGAAGSMSGGVDIRPFPNNWELSESLGEFSTHRANWEKETVINMVHLLQEGNLKLIFDCGVDDFFYDSNKRLHEKLLEIKIPHDYIERPGNHNWDYWSNSLKFQLLFFDEFFKSHPHCKVH